MLLEWCYLYGQNFLLKDDHVENIWKRHEQLWFFELFIYNSVFPSGGLLIFPNFSFLFFSFLGHYPCHLHVFMSPLTQSSLLFFLTPFPAPDHLQSQFPAVSFLNRSSVSLYGSGRVDGVMKHTKREQEMAGQAESPILQCIQLATKPIPCVLNLSYYIYFLFQQKILWIFSKSAC